MEIDTKMHVECLITCILLLSMIVTRQYIARHIMLNSKLFVKDFMPFTCGWSQKGNLAKNGIFQTPLHEHTKKNIIA